MPPIRCTHAQMGRQTKKPAPSIGRAELWQQTGTMDVHFVDVDGTAKLFTCIQCVASFSFLIAATHYSVQSANMWWQQNKQEVGKCTVSISLVLLQFNGRSFQGYLGEPVSIWVLLSHPLPSVLWRCWLGGRKGIRPVKTEWWGAGVVICLEWGADWHMAPADATATHCLLLQ